MKEIYLAGGCFWGTELFLESIKGVVETQVGYANGNTLQPTYEQVCYENTGHAETVKVCFDENVITLAALLEKFYKIIDPTSVNRQGGDTGVQYRTGIYYLKEEDRQIVADSLELLGRNYPDPIVVENLPLANYWPAEQYHQKYLTKNPSGYCHINRNMLEI